MFSSIKKFFDNINKDVELQERAMKIREKELELKEKELNIKNYFNENNFESNLKNKDEEYKNKYKNTKKEFKKYTNEEKKIYAQKMKDLKEKGKEYEEFVAGYYKLDGYSIYLHGIKKGKKDKGIDIICTKDDELILIQCKNWKENSSYKIDHVILKAFVGSCTEYINEHRLFDKKVKLKFITSNYILNESGKKFLEESKTLQYEILKF
jgi:hypothetical protein